LQKREDHNLPQKKSTKNIQLIGCGEFYHDILQSEVLDDVNLLKVLLTADTGLTSLKQMVPNFLNFLVF